MTLSSVSIVLSVSLFLYWFYNMPKCLFQYHTFLTQREKDQVVIKRSNFYAAHNNKNFPHHFFAFIKPLWLVYFNVLKLHECVLSSVPYQLRFACSIFISIKAFFAKSFPNPLYYYKTVIFLFYFENVKKKHFYNLDGKKAWVWFNIVSFVSFSWFHY